MTLPQNRLDNQSKSPNPSCKKQPKFIRLADWIVQRMTLRTDRRDSWVKVHLDFLDNPEFEDLPDSTKYHLLGLMLLVQRIGFNHLPNDEAALRRKLSANTRIDIELLRAKGFLIPVKRKRKNNFSAAHIRSAEQEQDKEQELDIRVRARQQTETEKRGVVSSGSRFSEDQCLAYTEHLKSKGTRIKGKPIESVNALAKYFKKTGNADDEIALFLNPPKVEDWRDKARGILDQVLKMVSSGKRQDVERLRVQLEQMSREEFDASVSQPNTPDEVQQAFVGF